MKFSAERLEQIFAKTDGHCHLCGKRLSFCNYAKLGTKAPWEVEHSRPKTDGGTDHLNNLYAACIACNRSKGAKSTRTERSKNGRSRAPRSAKKKASVRRGNTVRGAGIGGVLGGMFGGPVGAAFGSALGGALGHGQDPDD